MNFLARLFGGLLSRLLAVTLALTAAQFPVYYAQYLQTLSGARLEAELRYNELVREAGAVNLNAEDFIVRHEENSDPVFQASGRMHRTTLQRFIKLGAAYKTLADAAAIEKPVAFARNFDRDIAAATPFTPALPLTIEAAAYAFAGIVVAWLISAAFGALLLGDRRRYRPIQR